MAKFPEQALEQLTQQVLGGEAIFFIGSGFSLDSEANSSTNLLGRLLARFVAIAHTLANSPLYLEQSEGAKKNPAKAAELLGDLRVTFSLKGKPEEPVCLATGSNLEKLVADYYVFNDWVCYAFSELFPILIGLSSKPAWLRLFTELEGRLFRRLKLEGPLPRRITEDGLKKIGQIKDKAKCGKALFLETMGFSDDRIWGGNPYVSIVKARRSYEARIRPRHRVLAALAREGLTPILVTTNYDLLLEGAYRESGFQPRGDRRANEEELFGAMVRDFTAIGSAEQFCRTGEGYRTALIIKIHGCVWNYRQARQNTENWSKYLKAVVYTYREIQNWREDDWSRDLLCTLLRTRTMVFCGYSGMDPVLHDTFRTVYEEMERLRAVSADFDKPRNRPAQARAYYFDREGKRDFYGGQIMRAAEAAVGIPETQRNLIPFHIPEKRQNQGHNLNPSHWMRMCRFPNFDELLRWVLHRVSRTLQRRTLEKELIAVARRFLDRPPASLELKKVRKDFDTLCKVEKKTARGWRQGEKSRAGLEHIVGWTERFQAGLRRIFALRDYVRLTHRPGYELNAYEDIEWHSPISDHRDWTAWATVVEIAVRKMIAHWRGATWLKDKSYVRPAHLPNTAVEFRHGGQDPAPRCISIRFTPFATLPRDAGASGVYFTSASWNLRLDEELWAHEDQEQTPGALTIWNWAVGKKIGANEKNEDVKKFLQVKIHDKE